jgi:hypothetical protein
MANWGSVRKALLTDLGNLLYIIIFLLSNTLPHTRGMGDSKGESMLNSTSTGGKYMTCKAIRKID